MMKRFLITLGILLSGTVFAVTLPYTFSTTLPPSQINANFSALRDAINNHEALVNGHNTALSDVLAVGQTVGAWFIDFNLTELNQARLENLALDPACNPASEGRLIWNTATGNVRVCDGSAFVLVPSGTSIGFSFASEAPAGAINNVNVAFTISQTPIAGSFKLYKNGLRLRSGTDYSIAGAAITMVVAPKFGEILDSDYAY